MINKFIKNIGFAMTANLISLAVSTILILLVPRYIGVTNYGYFQLYLFYTTYISYLSFGITDGVYLRNGGSKYKDLNKKNLVSQYWLLVGINLLVTILCLNYIFFISNIGQEKIFILLMTCVSGFLVVPRSLLIFILQSTNRIKEYSFIVIIEKIIYFVGVIGLIFLKINNFEFYIVADIFGKIVAAILAIYICKDIVFSSFCNYKRFLRETYLNFSIGIKLFIANLSSMLIVGIVRFFIEKNWSIDVFGRVSLSFSIINMVLVFINSASVVLFPMIKNIDKDKQTEYYSHIRLILITVLAFILCLYFPGIEILSKILPNYVESFYYLSVLFPIIIFEGKNMVLVNTYLKAYRKENFMLIVNLVIVGLSFLFSILISVFSHNINIYLFLVLFLLALRNMILEFYLSRSINIKILKDILFELFLTISFLYVNLNYSRLYGFIGFFIIYCIYLLINKEKIKTLLILLKNDYIKN